MVPANKFAPHSVATNLQFEKQQQKTIYLKHNKTSMPVFKNAWIKKEAD